MSEDFEKTFLAEIADLSSQLSALKLENEKLLDKLANKHVYVMKRNSELEAELEKMTKERDVAVEALEEILTVHRQMLVSHANKMQSVAREALRKIRPVNFSATQTRTKGT